MPFPLFLAPLVALAAGIASLMVPRLLNMIVAVNLILFGLIGLMPLLTGLPGGPL